MQLLRLQLKCVQIVIQIQQENIWQHLPSPQTRALRTVNHASAVTNIIYNLFEEHTRTPASLGIAIDHESSRLPLPAPRRCDRRPDVQTSTDFSYLDQLEIDPDLRTKLPAMRCRAYEAAAVVGALIDRQPGAAAALPLMSPSACRQAPGQAQSHRRRSWTTEPVPVPQSCHRAVRIQMMPLQVIC